MQNIHSHYALLQRYLASEDVAWALATVVNKAGSSYRSPGAFMLVNTLGQSFGLVSGGCLEADIVRHAKQVFHRGQAAYVEYDMRDEDSFAAELGIGCQGKIGILIQNLGDEHRALLQQLYQRLSDNQPGYLLQAFAPGSDASMMNALALVDETSAVLTKTADQMNVAVPAFSADQRHQVFRVGGVDYSLTRIDAPFNFWVFGGGADAQPLVAMAAQLGWRVTVVDHRIVNARSSLFQQAEQLLKDTPDTLAIEHSTTIDAAVLMTHNLKLDAQWLAFLQQHCAPQYIGLLGPRERRHRVQALSEINDVDWLEQRLNGPAGLDLGGELPESIALSILAQCHATLHQRSGQSLNSMNDRSAQHSQQRPKLVNEQ